MNKESAFVSTDPIWWVSS